jgi:hypothetical protein
MQNVYFLIYVTRLISNSSLLQPADAQLQSSACPEWFNL